MTKQWPCSTGLPTLPKPKRERRANLRVDLSQAASHAPEPAAPALSFGSPCCRLSSRYNAGEDLDPHRVRAGLPDRVQGLERKDASRATRSTRSRVHGGRESTSGRSDPRPAPLDPAFPIHPRLWPAARGPRS